MRSTREHRAGRPQSLAQEPRRWRGSLLTLLRVGFTEPPRSPQALVVSYTTVSPLPPGKSRVAVCFLWHFPAGRPGSALPTTLPCGARTFLGAPGMPGATRPPGQLARRWIKSKAHRARLANSARTDRTGTAALCCARSIRRDCSSSACQAREAPSTLAWLAGPRPENRGRLGANIAANDHDHASGRCGRAHRSPGPDTAFRADSRKRTALA
jgi:hypothetical protein